MYYEQPVMKPYYICETIGDIKVIYYIRKFEDQQCCYMNKSSLSLSPVLGSVWIKKILKKYKENLVWCLITVGRSPCFSVLGSVWIKKVQKKNCVVFDHSLLESMCSSSWISLDKESCEKNCMVFDYL